MDKNNKLLAEKIIRFNASLNPKMKLPRGIRIMNPYEDAAVLELSSRFYRRFYSDTNPRTFIIGINPGRFGAGVTGVPFTDTKRLQAILGESFGFSTHEPSSEFIYRMIDHLGGPEDFYSRFYINSVCPLGFTIARDGKEVNYNYYDSVALFRAVKPFLVETMKKQLELNIRRDRAIVLGTGKNLRALEELNSEYHFFDTLVAVEHPRYIIQYKRKEMDAYLEKYAEVLGGSLEK